MLRLSAVRREKKRQGPGSRSLWQDAMRRLARNNAALVAGVLIVALFIVAVGANWIAGLVVRGIVDMDDAAEMSQDIAYRLAKKAYKL